jgi:hypothetical protein
MEPHVPRARAVAMWLTRWGVKGTVVGDGDTYEEALAGVKSAIRFHIETFGGKVLPDDASLIEAFITEATIPA